MLRMSKTCACSPTNPRLVNSASSPLTRRDSLAAPQNPLPLGGLLPRTPLIAKASQISGFRSGEPPRSGGSGVAIEPGRQEGLREGSMPPRPTGSGGGGRPPGTAGGVLGGGTPPRPGLHLGLRLAQACDAGGLRLILDLRRI